MDRQYFDKFSYESYQDCPLPGNEQIYRCLVRLIANRTAPVLDIGCGNGWIVNALARDGIDGYGVDPSIAAIGIANKLNEGRFIVANIHDSDFQGKVAHVRAQTVVSTEVIEHLYDPRALVHRAKEILVRNHGRQFIISTPYHGYWKNLALALSGKLDRHFTALWDGGHIKFFSRRTLQALLLEEGFVPDAFHGVGRLPLLWKSMVMSFRLPARPSG